jgi:hypothetical protein
MGQLCLSDILAYLVGQRIMMNKRTAKAAARHASRPGPSPGDAEAGIGSLQKLGLRHPEIARALAELQASGRLKPAASRKISARVDNSVLAAAAQRLGLEAAQVSDVVNASLVMAAAPDPFKQWLAGPMAQLSEDFELAV